MERACGASKPSKKGHPQKNVMYPRVFCVFSKICKHFSPMERACGASESSKKAIPKKSGMYPEFLSMYSPFWGMYPSHLGAILTK